MDYFNIVFKLPHALTEPVTNKLILNPQKLDLGLDLAKSQIGLGNHFLGPPMGNPC
jgi:hypothetical protein